MIRNRLYAAGLLAGVLNLGPTLHADPYDDALAQYERWQSDPFIAEAVRFATDAPGVVHLAGKNFGSQTDALKVTVNDLEVPFKRINANRIDLQLPSNPFPECVIKVHLGERQADYKLFGAPHTCQAVQDLYEPPGPGFFWRVEARKMERDIDGKLAATGSIEFGYNWAQFNTMVKKAFS